MLKSYTLKQNFHWHLLIWNNLSNNNIAHSVLFIDKISTHAPFHQITYLTTLHQAATQKHKPFAQITTIILGDLTQISPRKAPQHTKQKH